MVGIRIENDLIADAAAELLRIYHLLPSRHGDAYRALQRRIEALAETRPSSAGVASLDWDGPTLVLMATPPAEFVALIREARRLGL